MRLGKETSFDYFFGPALTADRLFGDLSLQAGEALGKIKLTEKLAPGTMICTAGRSAEGLYVLREGRAAWSFETGPGRRRPWRFAAPLEVVGVTEALGGQPFEASLETLTPCVVERIATNDFLALLGAEPQLCFELVKLLAANLQTGFRHLRSAAVRNPPQHL